MSPGSDHEQTLVAQSEQQGFGFPSAEPEQQEEEVCEASSEQGTSGQPRSRLSRGLEFLLQGGSINLPVGDWVLILLPLGGGRGDRLGRSRSQTEKD